MVLLAPRQCQNLPAAEKIIRRWIDDPSVPIDAVEYVALDQSMANGGGPACVRLRVSLTEAQYRQLSTACLLNEESYTKLRNWIERWYPERLTMSDLSRADLAEHVLAAIEAAPPRISAPPRLIR
jgi:succinylarginine dihydrolase